MFQSGWNFQLVILVVQVCLLTVYFAERHDWRCWWIVWEDDATLICLTYFRWMTWSKKILFSTGFFFHSVKMMKSHPDANQVVVSNPCYFSIEIWRNDPIWRAYFSNGLVQPPVNYRRFGIIFWPSPPPPKKMWFLLNIELNHVYSRNQWVYYIHFKELCLMIFPIFLFDLYMYITCFNCGLGRTPSPVELFFVHVKRWQFVSPAIFSTRSLGRVGTDKVWDLKTVVKQPNHARVNYIYIGSGQIITTSAEVTWNV